MTNNLRIYGAKACVYLEYSGDLKSLTKNLENKLNLPEFWFDTDQDFPYNEFAMCETLGFEVTIANSEILENYKYSIEFSTSNSTQEILYDRMHDISLWFANYISLIAKINTAVLNNNNETFTYFKGGNV